MQADDLDQCPDLWLSPPEQDRPAVCAQAAGQHCEVEHQRRVGEDQIREVDDDVRLRTNSPGQRSPSASLRGPVLVALAA
jgi:hypothetical protein